MTGAGSCTLRLSQFIIDPLRAWCRPKLSPEFKGFWIESGQTDFDKCVKCSIKIFTSKLSVVHRDMEIGRHMFIQMARYITSTRNACVEISFLFKCKWHWAIWQRIYTDADLSVERELELINYYAERLLRQAREKAGFPCDTCELVLERIDINQLGYYFVEPGKRCILWLTAVPSWTITRNLERVQSHVQLSQDVLSVHQRSF